LGLAGVKAALLHELLDKAMLADTMQLARMIKALPLVLRRPRPIDEAISSAGGVRFAALDGSLMLRCAPGVFCAGEMLDWEAPTGGYLLNACFASGLVAGEGAREWLARG
jgi:predicted flavoprotein YhiN